MSKDPPVLLIVCSNNHRRHEVARIVARGVYVSRKLPPVGEVENGVLSFRYFPKLAETVCEVNTPETTEPTQGTRTYTLLCRTCSKAAPAGHIKPVKIRESKAQTLYEEMRHAGKRSLNLETLADILRSR